GRVERLEQRLAEYHGAPFALTCGSGTFAVELALRALRVGPGDEVALAAYDYPGNFLSVHAVGATPLLVEVDPANCNLAPERLAEAVGPATKAVIASHLHGGLVPMREVMEFAAARGLRVVEDAAQCPGAVVQGRPAGTWGDVGTLSFGGSKLLTAGRGGAVLTRHADVRQRARVAIHRGNQVCPLSELQAAVLLPQLDKLGERNARRAENVRLLTERLAGVPGLQPFANRADGRPGYYKLGFRYDAAAFGLPRERFVAAVRAEGVALDEGFRALHAGRSASRFRRAGDLAEAERAGCGVVLLHHPVLLLPPAEIEEVAAAVRKVYANARALAGG
ncbi:MAG TPA: aminotransferase class I/II-fold pyridoxal phosphate-dependent enzyme, partial [Gemmataceae bacterium]|nr:aminotransferase class I/II-fold pyridoxal phosphate-dependent enzyme [Gemmataceae bacterium]